ncbi:MAG: CBS domain-containing protein [Microcoleus sp. PH2017_10_PVI_O_A]|uniref:CBS domain-containing protein n=1 Tax=unclassified Microcoleus TaxID=2642155 RepID=UPI001D5FD826|nr:MULTISPECIES: CBS domain-containing protein [unclassified Microcoleus]TAE85791.1 MAG: CBS domain-containing protein [Oscillatoriales cyanobacterium]MCC3404242.1 CBS domain-containing protein [Microcoleus sp. PH2017_10_PVI_O_A]MCC3458328.1 CBS domain-containing protein [Microcoleus sp. PH2017_11_PCY_U_A]MCC3478399.1 CBS domain-containing protein [Microcoleus sp. PH2017_12_PCY_D_A]MCC3529048.1 CBS domain-containing protein [Microcoleus sp. PH2017_21_RUC_O_A]
MDLVLCHTTADFDALGAAVGLCVLRPGSRIVLTGGSHPTVRDFLALHRDEYPLIERRSVNPQQIRSITIVDASGRDRLGKAAEWLDLPQLNEIAVFDHHLQADLDIPATVTQIEAVGATTTLIVEKLREKLQNAAENGDTTSSLQPSEATVMALGIHVDTGSLTFEGATARDAMALAWLMEQGASLRVISEYVEPGLSPQLQDLLKEALNNLRSETLHGYTVAWVLLSTEAYVPGLSALASRLLDLTESDALLLGNVYKFSENDNRNIAESAVSNRLAIIGRSRIEGTNLSELFKPLGGGGHARAASVAVRDVDPLLTLNELAEELKTQIPHPPTARELMSSPVRSIRPETSVGEAHRILLRYGHSGLSVVDAGDGVPPRKLRLAGIISRRDIDIALHHGFSHAPVKGYMTPQLKTIAPDTLLPEIEALMVTYDIGRLPVLENGQLVGIVTRTDVLRELHQQKARDSGSNAELSNYPVSESVEQLLRSGISSELWQLLSIAANIAQQRGWQLYIVGGAVRDLLLATDDKLAIADIDLVVDGNCGTDDSGAGVELASALQKLYPNSRLDIHGQFQTAALLWHKDSAFGSLWLDIATARTEFYPYPAANPEVEASSIRQDLYRRDFTINALAVRLGFPRSGELLDFFGGLQDLESRQIRVLHANSFIEDPTRIYRAVRFAVRLGFSIESQTEGYIRHALESGIYYRIQGENGRAPALETRLKSELKYILQAPYWQVALEMLGDLQALRCIHPTLELDRELWRRLRLLDRCLNGRKKSEGSRKKEEGSRKKEEGRGKKEEGRRKKEQTIPNAQFLMPDAQCPIPNAQFPMPNSQFPIINIPDWLMRLEVSIAYLAPEYRVKVAANLQLPADSIKRLEHLEAGNQELAENLPKCKSPSQLVFLLRNYEVPLLIAIALQSPRSARRQIWQYLTKWANVEPPLNGNDLKALGYKPGPGFKLMLDDLLAAALNGDLGDRASAISFLAQRYPQS